ncbi:MAG: stage 0 sporulation family protein [Clostridiales bacterium]|nr:stage 0 sporulation family protein [Clostridiales bacterium]
MAEVIGVRFKPLGKIYYFDPMGHSVPAGTAVVVETARGLEYGNAILANREVEDEKVVQPLRKLVRPATDEDTATMEEVKEKEAQARVVCLERIAQRQLPMKLVEVEYSFDSSKVLFYFTSEGRVDFRELVKDLAAVFKTRIELRQIGVRDEAKMLGGLGACGRELCCASFLSDFEPVSIRMAKEQNLSLNPSKISGICGRLMCCLKYESNMYENNKNEQRTPSREEAGRAYAGRAEDEAPEAEDEAIEAPDEGLETRGETPEARVEASEARAEASEAQEEAPETRVEASEVQVEAPEARVEAPEARVEASEVQVEAPEARVEAPEAQEEGEGLGE